MTIIPTEHNTTVDRVHGLLQRGLATRTASLHRCLCLLTMSSCGTRGGHSRLYPLYRWVYVVAVAYGILHADDGEGEKACRAHAGVPVLSVTSHLP